MLRLLPTASAGVDGVPAAVQAEGLPVVGPCPRGPGIPHPACGPGEGMRRSVASSNLPISPATSHLAPTKGCAGAGLGWEREAGACTRGAHHRAAHTDQLSMGLV